MKDPPRPSYRPAPFQRDWTKGSILGNLWSLSWPLLITYSINALGPTVDLLWIGRLGTAPLAGVGISATAIVVVNALVSGIFTGTSALVARFIGARDESGANHAAQQAFVIGITFSVVMALIGIFLATPIMKLLGIEEEVLADGAAYLRIQLVGVVTMTGLTAAQSIMQASGDTFTPMKISIGYRLLQFALCPALVFGLWIVPRLGVSGASLSNVIAQGVGGSIAIWYLFSGRSRLHVTLRNFRLNGNLIWRTVRIGIPASISYTERAVADLILVGFIIPFGTLAVAAHSLAQRVDQFVQNVGGGFGTPAAVLAGQNMGAGQPERAARTGWLAVGLATATGIFFVVVIWLWVEPILRIFNKDPGLVSIAATFLRIQSIGYLVWGLVVVFSLVLNGVGDTMIPMFTNLLTMVVVQLALAYVFTRYTALEANGIRWAIVSGLLVRGVIYPAYFASGLWKRKRV